MSIAPRDGWHGGGAVGGRAILVQVSLLSEGAERCNTPAALPTGCPRAALGPQHSPPPAPLSAVWGKWLPDGKRHGNVTMCMRVYGGWRQFKAPGYLPLLHPGTLTQKKDSSRLSVPFFS